MLRFLLFSEAAQPVEIDKKHKKTIKWHVTNNNIIFSTTTTCKQHIKMHAKFQQQQKENQFPLVFAVFSHLISLVFIKDRQLFGCFLFDLGVFVFEFLGASFLSLGCFVFEFWVLPASVFVFECFVFETTLF